MNRDWYWSESCTNQIMSGAVGKALSGSRREIPQSLPAAFRWSMGLVTP